MHEKEDSSAIMHMLIQTMGFLSSSSANIAFWWHAKNTLGEEGTYDKDKNQILNNSILAGEFVQFLCYILIMYGMLM